MNIYILTTRFALLWTCLLVAAIAAGADAPIAIEHVTVIEGNNGNTKPDTTIVITGSRITGVSPSSEISVPDNARRLDGRGTS